MRRPYLYLFLIVALSLALISACNSDTPHHPYTGKSLRIGLIGDPPSEVEGSKISFEPLTFSSLSNIGATELDAIFIMKDHLSEASKQKYSQIYTKLKIPLFFIGTHQLAPFYSDEITYHEQNYEPGLPYVVGVDKNGNHYAAGLYADQKNKETLELFYSDLFRYIEKIIE